MTTTFRLAPVYYPATFLVRRSLSRLAFLFGSVRLLLPPGLPQPREGLGSVVEAVTLPVSPERRRLIEAVLADYLRWAADHQGASYAVYLHQRRDKKEESLQEVKRTLQGLPAPEGPAPLPEDLGWQVFLRLAHDYDRQQEEIEAIMERVRGKERALASLTGLEMDEMDTGPAEFEEAGEAETPSVPEELTTGGRLAAFARLWLATGVEGTPLTESGATHEQVAERAPRLFGLAEGEVVEFACELPDASRLGLEGALERRAGLSGPLEGVLARLATIQALLRARAWNDEVRASVDLLCLELGEAAGRLCREAGLKGRLTLRLAVVPHASPERLFGRLAGQPEAAEPASGLYLLLEERP